MSTLKAFFSRILGRKPAEPQPIPAPVPEPVAAPVKMTRADHNRALNAARSKAAIQRAALAQKMLQSPGAIADEVRFYMGYQTVKSMHESIRRYSKAGLI